MASDTVPAATGTTDPNPTTPTAGAASAPEPKGWLASALAPVDPARPTFDLNPATTADSYDPAGQTPPGVDPAAVGASSGAYHDGDTSPDAKAAAARREQSIVRAWLLAGAERWRKGADARNKRLEVQKAKAGAVQVKEARTVNRSEKIVGGSTGSSTGSRNNAAKSLDNKTAKKDSGSKNGSAGRSDGSQTAGRTRNGSGGSSAGAGGADGTKTARKDAPKNGSSNGKAGPGSGSGSAGGSKTPGATGTGGASGTGKPGKDGASGSQGATGKDSGSGSGKGSKADHANSSSSGSSRGGGKPETTTCGDASGISKTKDQTSKGPTNTPGTDSTSKGGHNSSTKEAGAGAGTAGGSAGAKGTNTNTGAGKTPAPGDGTKPDLTKNPDTKGGSKNTPKTAKTPTGDPKTGNQAPTPAPSSRPTVNTQATREAGYRDGARAAKAVAHAEAYKDGAKDGYTDTRQAAQHDKTRLDNAHAQRQQDRTPPPSKEQPVTAAATSADYQPPQAPPGPPQAVPITVEAIDASHLRLGDGAARQVISRGEVRTLKQFERTLDTKADRMTRIADGTKALQAHAEEQAKHAIQLLEQAKAVKGGDNLTAALSRLEEAATVQVRRAADIHKRAVRAAESTTVLLANVETRYGGMYQAVVNSDETAPGEMSFYLEGNHA